MDQLESFLNIIPLQYIILLILCIGTTHISKVLVGNLFLFLSKRKETWMAVSLLLAIGSGYTLGYHSSYLLPEYFAFDSLIMGVLYAITTPLVGALMIHSKLRIFNGLSTNTDLKFKNCK
jgi:hypothetical protein